jgi:hypothetical protein
LGSLDCLTVERFDTDHVNATPNTRTGRYWRITGVDNAGRPASGFSMTLTLPTAFMPNGYTRVCRYTGVDKVWDCAVTGYDVANGIVFRSGIAAFADWAVGNVTPTAVTLGEFKAKSAPGNTLALGLVMIGLGGLWLALLGLRWSVAVLGFAGPADVAALPVLALVMGAYAGDNAAGQCAFPLTRGLFRLDLTSLRWRPRRGSCFRLRRFRFDRRV